MNVLGISCFYHDSAACLIRDGEIVAAAQEERFSRIKHDPELPVKAVEYCLEEAGITIDDVDYLAFYDKPFLKFERILLTYLYTFPRSYGAFLRAIPQWLGRKIWVPVIFKKELGYNGPIVFPEHHMSHAASTFLVSPFEEAAILTVDGVGEWATATYGKGSGTDIEIIKEIRFPHSLGLLYSAITYYLGFKVNSAEYKVMGLAPYGEPSFMHEMRELVEVRDDGSFKMNMKYFAYHYGLRMTNRKFDNLFGGPPRDPESVLDKRHKDIAASLQVMTEEIMLKMANHLHEVTGLKKLCMAGGVALNCVANGRILRESHFDDIFIQPAASDAGGALGAAAFCYHSLLKNPRKKTMPFPALGPKFNDDEIKEYLDKVDVKHERLERSELLKRVAKLIGEQNVIGWYQGRMEFGPRALGDRSILADARNPKNRDVVNLKIKFRESFRPFAPSVLVDKCPQYFELDRPSPYMLIVVNAINGRSVIPSVTHVDGSARVQTVSREDNELYYDLIKEFENQTGCSVIINTSFNVRGEPIVCTPHDAFVCFMRTNMDYLALGSYLLDKKDMPPLEEDFDWREVFPAD